jgi:hypothetical protein
MSYLHNSRTRMILNKWRTVRVSDVTNSEKGASVWTAARRRELLTAGRARRFVWLKTIRVVNLLSWQRKLWFRSRYVTGTRWDAWNDTLCEICRYNNVTYCLFNLWSLPLSLYPPPPSVRNVRFSQRILLKIWSSLRCDIEFLDESLRTFRRAVLSSSSGLRWVLGAVAAV